MRTASHRGSSLGFLGPWIGGCALAVTLALAGCTPESTGYSPDSGAGASGEGGRQTGIGGNESGSGGATGAGTGGVVGGGSGGSGNGGSGSGGSGNGGSEMPPIGGRSGTGSGGAPGAGGSLGSGGKIGAGGAIGTGGKVGTGGNGVGGATGSGGKAGGTGGKSGTLQIMPLGDSTTASICYRSHLWQMLTQAGHTNFNFIGTRNGDPGCTFTGYDKDNEGHGGYIVTDLLKAAGTGTRPSGADMSDPYVSDARDLVTWFDGHPADIVLMHFGTNDVWNNISYTKIVMAYSAILAKLRANNPNVRLMIAQITPLDPTGCTTCAQGVIDLNSAIVTWAANNNTAASPIDVVDQYDGFNATTDTKDGVHATDAGSIKIATNWYNALVPLF